jgi:hypothetical protein
VQNPTHFRTRILLPLPSLSHPDYATVSARSLPRSHAVISMILKHQSSKAWATICDVGAFAPGGPQRTILVPPRDAAGFEQLLGALNFTNGSDKEMVLALYQATLHTALGQTRSLRYTGLRWGDTEMAGLVKVLPLCSKLKYLNLKGSHNAYTDASADALADLLSYEGVLPQLHMIGAGCREKGAQEPDPLLENARLRGACESRGIELLRDVPEELMYSRASGMMQWPSSSSHAPQPPMLWEFGRVRAHGSARERRRSSVVMSMRSVARLDRVVRWRSTKNVVLTRAAKVGSEREARLSDTQGDADENAPS